jgi:hypothetical protein
LAGAASGEDAKRRRRLERLRLPCADKAVNEMGYPLDFLLNGSRVLGFSGVSQDVTAVGASTGAIGRDFGSN